MPSECVKTHHVFPDEKSKKHEEKLIREKTNDRKGNLEMADETITLNSQISEVTDTCCISIIGESNTRIKCTSQVCVAMALYQVMLKE